METEELVIDQTNFYEYFFDVRQHGPKEGQIMAKFTAVAIFGEGDEKKDLINVLVHDKSQQAAAVMHKIHMAKPPDNYRVCREICEDLASGMTVDEVMKKEYEFLLEALYYTKREYVPENDPHWETIQLLDYDAETGAFNIKIQA